MKNRARIFDLLAVVRSVPKQRAIYFHRVFRVPNDAKILITFLRLVLAIMHMGSINITTKITRITRALALNITKIEITSCL